MSALSHIVLSVARVVIGCCGILLVYVALFLYENENGELQNRLEDLWVRIDDAQKFALSKQASFLREVLRLANSGFDSLLGKRLFSHRAIFVTLCYSIASAALYMGYELSLADNLPLLGGLAIFCGYAVLGTSALAFRGHNDTWRWSAASIIALTIAFRIFLYYLSWAFSWAEDFATLGSGLAGVGCDILFVAANRALFRLSSKLNMIGQIAAVLVCNLSLAVLYILPALKVVNDGWPDAPWVNFVVVTAATNFITAFLALGIVLLMCMALLHRVLWPIVNRLVYAISRYVLVRKPARLLSAAVILLTWAIPAWNPLWKLIVKGLA